ncbi:MAG: sugar phosphate nucleotidyltransferase [bacterium]|nr:NTP transferase domain-containing protein [Gemmatimonadota bacterium]
MRAVILAGGRGTRLAPYTVAFPKPLMPLGDRPILEIVIRQLRYYGFTRVTMAVGHLAELLQAYFGDGSKFGLAIDYSREEEPLGTAGPLRLIPDLDEDFLVMNGDLLTDLDYGAFMRRHREQKNDATIGVYEKEVRIDLGVLERDPEGRVVDYREKPTLRYEVSMGVYAFRREVLSLIPDGYFDFPNLVLELIRRDRPIRGFSFHGSWLDIGRQEDYGAAIETFERERERFLPGE